MGFDMLLHVIVVIHNHPDELDVADLATLTVAVLLKLRDHFALIDLQMAEHCNRGQLVR